MAFPPSVTPLLPGFQYGAQFYAITQEIYQAPVSQSYAESRCQILASTAIATTESVEFALVDSSGCIGYTSPTIVSCTFVSSRTTIEQFVSWLSTSPIPPLNTTCVPMQLAVSARTVQDLNDVPPSPPQMPEPPFPPPRPFPSPPPPPPCPPPSPPATPPGPSTPPSPSPTPPTPPMAPPSPPSFPSTVQIASQNLCHSTCVSFEHSTQHVV